METGGLMQCRRMLSALQALTRPGNAQGLTVTMSPMSMNRPSDPPVDHSPSASRTQTTPRYEGRHHWIWYPSHYIAFRFGGPYDTSTGNFAGLSARDIDSSPDPC
ncbi:hypothetical protein PENSPDRAFT_110854 [Peniophora sp. CONT]|nr:hypothetical protein PENSPDRAFT_110854 [Peniophora sp. CONT]